MTFAPGPGETVKCFYPFFSMMPLGYGNFFPAAIVLLSIACALLLIFAPKARLALLVCLVLSVLANVASWILFASFTAVGLGIFLAQAFCCFLAIGKTPGLVKVQRFNGSFGSNLFRLFLAPAPLDDFWVSAD